MKALIKHGREGVVGEILTLVTNFLMNQNNEIKIERVFDQQLGDKVLLFKDAEELCDSSSAGECVNVSDVLMYLGSKGRVLLGKDMCFEEETRDMISRLESVNYELFNEIGLVRELNESLEHRNFVMGRSMTLMDLVLHPILFAHFSSLADKDGSYVPEWSNITKFFENIQLISSIRQSFSENLRYLDLPFFKRRLGVADKTKPARKDGGGDKQDKRPVDDPTRIALKIGRILSVDRHPTADKLYVEKIDLGEDEPRTVLSGLVGVYDLTKKINELVVVVANLKPRSMRGIVSSGMLLCASSRDESPKSTDGGASLCEPVSVPKGARVGELVYFDDYKGEPDPVLSTKTGKDPFAAVQPFYNADENQICRYKESQMLTSAGPLYVENRSIVNPKLS